MTTTLDRMASQLSEWEHRGDGRAVFLDCYRNMTEAVLDSVERDEFVDGVWVSALLDRFAGYYFDSIDGGPDVRPIPSPWVLAHAAAVGNDASALQLLLAGVNAHINYDLVLTLVDVLDDEWVDLGDRGRAHRRADYDRINVVIADTADRVQDDVLERRSPWLDAFDRGLGRWDERTAVRLLTTWRTRVWRQATELLDGDDPAERAGRAAAIERQCTRRARWLLL
jgi:hypothetical protein